MKKKKDMIQLLERLGLSVEMVHASELTFHALPEVARAEIHRAVCDGSFGHLLAQNGFEAKEMAHIVAFVGYAVAHYFLSKGKRLEEVKPGEVERMLSEAVRMIAENDDLTDLSPSWRENPFLIIYATLSQQSDDIDDILQGNRTLQGLLTSFQNRVLGDLSRIEEKINERSQVESSHVPVWDIPTPSAYSTGQKAYMEDLAAILDAGGTGGITQRAGLRGFGGIGKTELALAYAKAQKVVRYDTGHFIKSDTLEALDVGLAKIADSNMPPDATQAQIESLKAAALAQLNNGTRTLVVFDNVDEIVGSITFREVLAALPRAHVIVTCRHPDMGGEIQQLSVKKMDEDVGALYVLRVGCGDKRHGPWEWEQFTENDRKDALALSHELDGLPLALHHAGTAMRGESMTAGEVLADYQTSHARILGNRDRNGPATHPESAQIMVTRAFERLNHKDRAAAELVLCCAFLAPDNIAEDLFTKGLVEPETPLTSEARLFAYRRTLAVASALVERDPSTETLNIHRVTQAVLQDMRSTDVEARLSSVTNAGIVALYRAGRYREAIAHAQFGAELGERLLGSESLSTLSIAGDLAFLNYQMGRYVEARRQQLWTLKRCRKAPDINDRFIDILVGNLALTYAKLKRYRKALCRAKSTLALRMHRLGPLNEDTLSIKTSVGLILSEMGRLDDAAKIQEETLEECQKALPGDHSLIHINMGNLAATYAVLKRYDDSYILRVKTLELRREILRHSHPLVLTSMNDLAMTYLSLGRHGEAVSLLQQTVSEREAVLGVEHPDTYQSRENLRICREAMEQKGKETGEDGGLPAV